MPLVEFWAEPSADIDMLVLAEAATRGAVAVGWHTRTRPEDYVPAFDGDWPARTVLVMVNAKARP